MTKTKIYKIWQWILKRCNKEYCSDYNNYWWRGIKVEWSSFEKFYEDMWNTYIEWLSIDRIDNNWNYSKENCRWTTMKEQSRNTRANVIYNWKCIAERAEELWWDKSVIHKRVKMWWDIWRACLTKINKSRKY